MRPPRVLFVNHTGELAGAERSLLDLLESLSGQVEATVASPAGELLGVLRARGYTAVETPGTALSFRPHPVQTPRGLAELTRAAVRIGSLARRTGAEIVHANTERAGLFSIPAARARGLARGGGPSRPAVVVHARAPFPANRLGQTTARALAGGADAIIANSRFSAAQFGGQGSALLEVVHNPVDSSRFDPAAVDGERARGELGLIPGQPVMAIVGYLAPVKCQDDAIRILAAVRGTHPDAVLLVAGSTRFSSGAARDDNSAYAAGLRRLTAELGVADGVRFLGECDDVRRVIAAADLLLVPSRHEGFGRVVLEGMAMGTPVLATEVGGPPEIIREGRDGMLLAPGDPDRWAAAASELLSDAGRRAMIGMVGRERAVSEFSPRGHADAVMSVYRRLLEARG